MVNLLRGLGLKSPACWMRERGILLRRILRFRGVTGTAARAWKGIEAARSLKKIRSVRMMEIWSVPKG